MKISTYYVYALVDPRTDLPFYIGKGSGNRAYSHLKDNRVLNENRFKKHVILGIRALGLEPTIRILQDNILDETEAYCIEKMFIEQFGKRIDGLGPLTNIFDANSPSSRFGESNPFYGKTHSIEVRAKIASSNRQRKGRNHSEETKQKMAASQQGKRHTEESREKIKVARSAQIIPKEAYVERGLRARGRPRLSARFEWTIEKNDMIVVSRSLASACRKLGIPYSTARSVCDSNKTVAGWSVSRRDL
jgi:hypothetical protein